MKLLLLEDDPLLNRELQQLLQHWGYICDLASDGSMALAMADASHYDLILLDLNLPKADGLTVTGRLRRQSRDHQPLILILTARGEKADQLAGLAYGADDDVIKLLDAEILQMRIRALLRRREKATVLEGYRWGDLQISSEQMQASYQQQPLQLTPKEILILEALIRANGQACSKASLIDAGGAGTWRKPPARRTSAPISRICG